MALAHRYTIICDEIRIENNGKLIVIGMYTGTMTVPMIPFLHPGLCFMFIFDADRPGDHQFRARLEHLEEGHSVGQSMGVMQVPQPGPAVNVVGFRNITIDRIGTYTISLFIDQEREPITASINVMLQSPPQQQMRR